MPPQGDSKKPALDVAGTAATAANGTPLSSLVLAEHAVQVDDKVYDVQKLSAMHPGGELFVKVFAGRDASEAFLSYHRRVFPHEKMAGMLLSEAKPSLPSRNTLVKDKEYLELCALVEAALPRHKSFAPPLYYFKLVMLFGATLALEAHIHTTKSYFWHLTALQGLLFALVGMNIQHDANHGSISRNPIINRVLGMTQNWIGGSALDWVHQHDVQHHLFPNDANNDPDIVGNHILRLNPLKPLLAVHALQYVYIFLLLALFGATYIFFSLQHNLEGFHMTSMSPLVASNRRFEEFTIMCFALRWLVLPVWQTGSIATLLQVLPMFVAGGYYLAFFFLLSHNFEGVKLFGDCAPEPNFLRRQVVTASNVGGAWLGFLNGGLNYQIEHHLFPRIQHSHYPLIAPIVKKFCDERGIPYVHFPTVWDNMMSCLRHLYTLGHRQTPPGYKVNAQ